MNAAQATMNRTGVFSDSMGWNIVTGSSQLEELAEEAHLLHFRPRRLEHDLLWLSRADHGEHSTCGAIAFYREGALIGYLPFRLRLSSLPLRLGEVTLARLPFRALQLYSDGMVGEKAEAAWVITALAQVPLPYDGLILEETPTDSALWRGLQEGAKSFLVFERSRAPHSVIDLPSSYAIYFQGLPRKTRENIRRHSRKLGTHLDGWEVRKFTASEQIHEMVELVEAIATKTYHFHLLRQDLTASNKQLIRNLKIYAREGWLRGYVLLGDHRPIAYVVGYLVNGCFQSEFTGYHPAFARYSPGILLQLRVIEDLINTGTADFLDFGAGGASYKRELGNRLYEEGTLLVCRRTLYACSAAISERLFADASRVGACVLHRTGLKGQLKRFLRSKWKHTVR
jgi:CelD/BcsL family acetyltransferase involved in cellulose biosynthesis